MGLLDRYIARTVLFGTLMVLFVLAALDSVFTFVREFDEVGKGNYDLPRAVLYVLATLPGTVYLFFSTAVLLGSLMGLGALANNSELIVMRAAGVSTARIIRSVLQAGLILMIMSIVIGEWAAPMSEQYAQKVRSTALAKGLSLKSKAGLWMRDGTRFVNIQGILPDLHLRDITVYEFDGNNLRVAIQAATAIYDKGQWELHNLRYSHLKNARIETRIVDKEVWPNLVNPELFNVLSVRPEGLSALNLYRYVTYLKANQLESDRHELALWGKLVTPLSSMVMLLLAIPFVFGSPRSSGTGQRVLIGTLIGIGYFLLTKLLTHVGLVYGLAPSLSALLPVVLFLVGGVVLLRVKM